ncbi:hypothetical protein D1Z90_20610 [Motilimonas pumila]|uniref:Uncharacterized protein n=2 Tax=Motilimonas pumila TaxID=2303987 RepID=A0A418Y920_9GAMM|nr:hypothetical protein D1Z90_20610 [Motilimonas pumila]
MAFNIEAFLKDTNSDLNLDSISRIVSEYVPYAKVHFDEGCPPFIDKHIKVTVSETDFGEAGDWTADVLLESGELVNQCAKEALLADGSNRIDIKEIGMVQARVRVYFRSDDEQKYTNTMIDLMSFLESIPNAAVYDSNQNKFVE